MLMIQPAEPELFRAMKHFKAFAAGAKSLLHFDPAMNVLARRKVNLAEINLNVLSQRESTRSKAVFVR
ncbi:MAG: hypothetical protein ACO1QS_20795 [Verrucomicrobiota bacterium]